MRTYWVTFYSYKGGVGRSMALANVAAALAALDRRIVMIDFDLEAPGLDSFEEFGVPQGQRGLVEYVSHYLETGTPAPITNHVHEINPVDLSDPENPKTYRIDGRLWLMTAGAKDKSYNQKRLSIDWADLYESHSGAEFFENLKAEIEDTYRPDYVLVDSRTGLTDVGGICTLHLPDLVVLLFALNEQNLQGIASVARVIRSSAQGPITLPVATPVPRIEWLVDDRMKHAKDLLNQEIELKISYSPYVATKEQIFYWGGWDEVVKEYDEIETAIRRANRGGIDFLVNELANSLDQGDLERAKTVADRLEKEFPERSETWSKRADYFATINNLIEIEKCLKRGIEISPTSHHSFDLLRLVLIREGREQDLLEYTTWILDHYPNLAIEFRGRLYYLCGEISMQLKRYDEAALRFSLAIEADEIEQQFLDTREEIFYSNQTDSHLNFCIAEAKRRISGKIDRIQWCNVVNMMEKSALFGYRTASIAGGQAASIAFACAGRIEEAIQILQKTERMIERSSPLLLISSATDFRIHDAEEFYKITQQMLEALDRGELWDGMKLG
jgi:tetratricopeptide (TPR) repeat protein